MYDEAPVGKPSMPTKEADVVDTQLGARPKLGRHMKKQWPVLRRFGPVKAVFVGALMFLVASCGGATRAAEEARPETSRQPSPAKWLPPESFVMGYVHVARLRDSPYAGTVAGWYDAWVHENSELDEEARRASDVFEAVWQRTRSVHVGVAAPPKPPDGTAPPGSDKPEIVIAMRGRYGHGAVERWIREIPDVGDMLEVRSRDGRRVLELDELCGVQIDASTWVFTLDAHLDRLIHRLREPSKGLRSAALRRLQRDLELRRGALGLVLEPIPEIRAELLEELRGDSGDDAEVVAALHALGLRIDVSNGLQVRTVATMKDAASAHRLRKRADSLGTEYRDNAFVILAGLDLLLRETRTRVNGNQAVGILDLDHAQTHALLFHWDRLARGAAALILGDAEDGGLLQGLGIGAGSSRTLAQPPDDTHPSHEVGREQPESTEPHPGLEVRQDSMP